MKLPAIPNSISRRVALYGMLIAVLITSAVFLMPNVLTSALANYFSIAPINKIIFAPHPSLCGEAQERIKKLSVAEKIDLAQFIAKVLEQNASARHFEENTLINTLGDMLIMDTENSISKQAASENCVIESLRTLGNSASPAFSVLLEMSLKQKSGLNSGNMNEILANLVRNDPENVKILGKKIFDPGNEQSVEEFNRLWGLYLQSGSPVYRESLEQIDKFPKNSKKYDLLLQGISMRIMQEPTLDSEIVSYILDSSHPVDNRLALLERIRNASKLSLLSDETIQKLSRESDQRFFEMIQSSFQNRMIKNQDDLNRFFEVNRKIFQEIELKKPEDWGRVDEIVKFLQTLTNRVSSPGTVLNYTEVAGSIIKILDIIAEQLGYQTEIYKKLTAAVQNSVVAKDMAPYWEGQLSRKSERVQALKYLLKMEGLSDRTQNKIAEQLLLLDDTETVDCLSVFSQFRLNYYPHLKNKPSPVPKPIFNAITDLFKRENETVAKAAYDSIISLGEPIVIYVRERMQGASGVTKLHLSRINWHYSSTENAFKVLQGELKKMKTCDGNFALAFIEMLPKSADSPGPRKKPTDAGAGAKLSDYNSMIISPDFKIKQPPPPELFAKYLKCDPKYLQKNAIYRIAQINDQFKKLVELEAESAGGDKKAFLSSALKNDIDPPPPPPSDEP